MLYTSCNLKNSGKVLIITLHETLYYHYGNAPTLTVCLYYALL